MSSARTMLDLNARQAQLDEQQRQLDAEREVALGGGASIIREATAKRREASVLLQQAVTAIWGEDPYAGYFSWDWSFDEQSEVVTIRAATRGGFMDSVRQPLEPVRFLLGDLAEVIAGNINPREQNVA